MVLIIGRLYILFNIAIATLISALIIYQAYHSNFLNSPLLKITISALAIAGSYGLILPAQTPTKFGIKPEITTQTYFDKLIKRKLEYRIAPNNKIEIYEVPHFIVFRKKIVYIGIALLTSDRNVLAKLILNKIDAPSVNPLKKELAFWQGIASVTSDNFQFWKPFTNWYIRHLKGFVSDVNCPLKHEENTFNSYITAKLQANEFDIFESYVRSKNSTFIGEAINLDSYCKKLYIAGNAILTNKELTYGDELVKYEDVCQLANLDIINLSKKIIDNGFDERHSLNIEQVIPIQLTDTQYAQIVQIFADICPHIYIMEIAKKKLKYVPEIPSYVIKCIQQKTHFDINERTNLIQKQLQSKLNELQGDWTIVVFNNKQELLQQ